MGFVVGDPVVLSNTFTVSGTATDPSLVSLSVTTPAGVTTTYTYAAAQITRTSAGLYTKTITVSAAGAWRYVWTGTGTAADVAPGSFRVDAVAAAVPLATLADINARRATALTSAEEVRVEAILRDASAAVRGYTGQHLTEATETLRIKARTGVVRLPQRPVTAVSVVEDPDDNAISFEWWGDDRVYVGGLTPLNQWELNMRRAPVVYLDITYTHGYATIPDDIVAVVCQIAARAAGVNPEDSGKTSETITNYSYSTGGAAAAGGVGMLSDERSVLDRYRRPGGTAVLAS